MQRAIQVFRKEKEMRPHTTIGNVVLHVPEAYMPTAEKHKVALESFGSIDTLSIQKSSSNGISIQYDEN
jgi:hypothetical protein